jgi:hypothetical protein
MTDKPSNEREVLDVILGALDGVSDEGRERILKTVSTFYDLGIVEERRPIATGPRSLVKVEANDRTLNFTERQTLSPKEFLHEKQPQTDIERVACLAYFLTHYRDTPNFKTISISKLNTEAAQLKFSNAAVAVANAAAGGLLAPAGRGTKQISAVGEQFVAALPNRDEAKAVLAKVRRRRTRRKSPGQKQRRKAGK